MKRIFKTATALVIAGALSASLVAFAACGDDDEHTHTYGEAVWTWATDYSSAKATFTCTDDDDTQEVTATVTSETTTAATCTTAGEITYTATATFEGETYTDTKTGTIAANGHTYSTLAYVTDSEGNGSWQGTCSVCNETVTVTDTSGYTLLADSSAALSAALTAGGNVQLTADVAGDTAYDVADSVSVTLDLNGYTISQKITVEGSLTIDDTSTDADGGISVSESNTSIVEVNGGSLVINGGTLSSSEYYGIYCLNGGSAVVNDGVISSYYAALSGNNTTGDMNFTVNGGTISATYGPAIYMPGQVELTITGGTINGGVSLRMGIVNISGGTINSITESIDSPATYYNYSGNAWLPDAVYVFAGTYTSDNATYGNKLEMNITGGTFNCGNDQGSAVAIYDLGKVEQTASVTISGGTFITSSTTRSAYQVLSLSDIGVTSPATGYGTYSGHVSTTITGGIFSSTPVAYIDTTNYDVVSSEGYYTVTSKS